MNLLSVVYFTKQLGDAHFECWLKSSFYIFKHVFQDFDAKQRKIVIVSVFYRVLYKNKFSDTIQSVPQYPFKGNFQKYSLQGISVQNVT